MSRVLVFGVVAILAAAGARVAHGGDITLYGNESVAYVDDARGAFINPAAVGARYPSELILSWGNPQGPDNVFRALGALGGLGLAVDHQKGVITRIPLTLGGGPAAGRLGVGFSWLKSEASGDRATDLQLGLLSRARPWSSFGFTVDHLAEPRFDGERMPRTYTLGLGLRPLAWSRPRAHTLGTQLTLTGDVVMLEGEPNDAARVRLGLEVEPLPGLALRGSVENPGGFRVGLGLLGLRSSGHASSIRDEDGDHLASAAGVSFHGAEERTVLARAARGRLAVIAVGGYLGDDALTGFSLLDGPTSTRSVTSVHHRLQRALEDPLTRGVLLEVRGCSNMAAIEELRPRIARLRAAGKPVVAFLEVGGSRADLMLAAACDRVVATPEGLFGGLGLRAERRYYRRALAEWGVRFDRSSIGRNKSAYRSYSADSTPPADREAIEHNLDVSQELFVSTVSADRDMSREALLRLLDGRAWPPEDLASAGLIDTVAYREVALRIAGSMSGLGNRPSTWRVPRDQVAKREWTLPERIAVVYVSGGIDLGRSGNDLLNGPFIGATTLVTQVERAFRHPDVEAVVLRIESPGGSALAADLMLHAIERLHREHRKPLIVSMGTVAASGGYYIALAGERLYADRATRTGSIGVVYVKPSIEQFYTKHDVRQDVFQRGAYQGAWSLNHDWTRAEQASADSSLARFYDRFVAKVARARGLSPAAADSAAQGRVWMGEDAKRLKLVDEIGGLEEAIAEARRRAGIPDGERIHVVEYRRPRPPWLQGLAGNAVRSWWESTMRLPEPGSIYFVADPVDDP